MIFLKIGFFLKIPNENIRLLLSVRLKIVAAANYSGAPENL